MEYGVRGTGYGGTGGELGVHGVRGTGYSGRARRRWDTEYGVRRASWAYTEYGVWGTAAGVPREWGPRVDDAAFVDSASAATTAAAAAAAATAAAATTAAAAAAAATAATAAAAAVTTAGCRRGAALAGGRAQVVLLEALPLR